MQVIQKKEYENLVCNEYFWEALPMWILNICIFAYNSEYGALILYIKKSILKIKKKMQSIVNSFVFFIKFHVKAKNPPL